MKELPVTVVVPVFNGYDVLRRLCATLFANTGTKHKIVFVDDASTDERISQYLGEISNSRQNVVVLRNDENKGFPATVNRGASAAEGDFVLLNTDTEVPPNWIPRLFAPIWDDPTVASAMPATNSFPSARTNLLPAVIKKERAMRLGVDEVDREVRLSSPAEAALEWKVNLGFCIVISHKAWLDTGPFDAEAFGRGYFEELDWCARARYRHGYRHVVVPGLFVAHWHNGSFSSAEKYAMVRRNKQIFNDRNPQFSADRNPVYRQSMSRLVADRPWLKLPEEQLEAPVEVSVVVPVYNVEKYLRRCLDSLIAQTLKRIEIICVDDGSTDSSPAILAEYAARDPRIKVMRQDNAGAGVARNLGLKAAHGGFLYFMDADDACLPEMLEKMWRKARETDADIVITHKAYVDPETFQPSKIKSKPFPEGIASINGAVAPADIANRLFTVAKSVPWDKMFRRSLVLAERIEFQNTHRSNDVFFTDLALALAARIAFVPQDLYLYSYRRKGSLTGVKDEYPMDILTAYGSLESALRARGLWNLYATTYARAFAASVASNLREYKVEENYRAVRDKAVDKLMGMGRADLASFVATTSFRPALHMDANPPRVSVVVPVYNVEKYLRRSLDSILGQTLADIEVICVDDGSTDGSAAILAEYAAKDGRVRVIAQNNAGAGAARNSGIGAARGDYLFFFDPDDSCDRRMLEVMYGKAKRTNADVVVAGKKIADAETGRIVKDVRIPWKMAWFMRQPFSPRKIADRLFSFAKAVPWDKMFRRSFVERNMLRFQCVPRSNDVYFVNMALALAKRIALVRKGYYVYTRKREGSLTFGKDKWPLATYNAYSAVEESLKEQGLWERFRMSLSKTYFALVVDQVVFFHDKAAFDAMYSVSRAKIIDFQKFADLSPQMLGSPKKRERAKLLLENESPDALWHALRGKG